MMEAVTEVQPNVIKAQGEQNHSSWEVGAKCDQRECFHMDYKGEGSIWNSGTMQAEAKKHSETQGTGMCWDQQDFWQHGWDPRGPGAGRIVKVNREQRRPLPLGV